MIKLLVIGLWVCVVSLGSSYVAASFAAPSEAATEKPTYFEGLDYRKTDPIAVAVIAENAIQGYVIARFVYTIDGKTAASLAVPPDPIILDEAFRSVYSTANFDFRAPERFDLAALTDHLRDSVNKRYGRDIVESVLIDQFDFMPRNQMGGEKFKIDQGGR